MGLRTFLGLKRPWPKPEVAHPPKKKKPKSAPLRPIPWITDGSLAVLEKFVADRGPHIRAIEMGAGASTLWLAPRVGHLLSLEHHTEWHKRIVSELVSRRHTADVRRIARPYFYELEPLPDASFDLILIDGRDRVECLRRARRLLAQDGLLIIDNTERVGTPEQPGRYFEMLELLKDWDCEVFGQDGPDRTGWIAPFSWSTTVCRRTRHA
jgi:predicted O-methyltransferase YrrM